MGSFRAKRLLICAFFFLLLASSAGLAWKIISTQDAGEQLAAIESALPIPASPTASAAQAMAPPASAPAAAASAPVILSMAWQDAQEPESLCYQATIAGERALAARQELARLGISATLLSLAELPAQWVISPRRRQDDPFVLDQAQAYGLAWARPTPQELILGEPMPEPRARALWESFPPALQGRTELRQNRAGAKAQVLHLLAPDQASTLQQLRALSQKPPGFELTAAQCPDQSIPPKASALTAAAKD